MEERFQKRLKDNKRFVTDNALRAQASLNLVNDLYKGAPESETASGVTPAARAAIEMMNKSNNPLHTKKSSSQTPAQDPKRETNTNLSAVKSDTSEVRRRMLQIRGFKGAASPRERFNEDTNEEAKSIRERMVNQVKLNLTDSKLNAGENGSHVSRLTRSTA